jgi:capsular exopolysaccharide synthesis family protein
MLNLGLGLLTGLIGGVMVALIRETLDKRISLPQDLRETTGNSSTISVIPAISQPLNFDRVFRFNKNQGLHDGNDKFLIEKPDSIESEAMRNLYTSILLGESAAPVRTLIVISASAQEGKTTIASNLAIALARRAPTCFVDADLRKAGRTHRFGLNLHKGLGDFLNSSAAIDRIIAPVPEIANLSLIAAGHPQQNPSDLMAVELLQSAICELRSRFTYVVFDSPPLLPYADARPLSTIVDGIIFVVRSGSTPTDAISRSMEILSEIHSAPVLGFVLNGVHSHSAEQSYKYGY